MIKNHLLSIIVNNSKSTKCKFLNMINSVKHSPNNLTSNESKSSLNTSNVNSSQTTTSSNFNNTTSLNKSSCGNLSGLTPPNAEIGDDLKYRFYLFNLIVKNGTYCKNLDPDLTSMHFKHFRIQIIMSAATSTHLCVKIN